MSLNEAEEHLVKSVHALEKIFNKNEEFLENLGSSLVKYVDILGIVKPLSEAAGAEIDVRGRASKETIYGKRKTKSARGKTGKGLIHFMSEKSWVLAKITDLIVNEKKAISEETQFLLESLKEGKESFDYLDDAGESLGKDNKKEKRKLKMLKKISEKIEKLLEDIVKKSKEDEDIFEKNVKYIKLVSRYSLAQGVATKRMMRFGSGAHYYKRLTKYFNKENKYFRRIMTSINKMVKEQLKEIKDIIGLVRYTEKLQKIIGKKSDDLGDEEKDFKKDLRDTKKLKVMMKKVKKVQRSIGKIRKASAKFGAEINKGVSLMKDSEKELLEDTEELEKELDELSELFQNLNKMNGVVTKLLNNIYNAEFKIKPLITWINSSFVTMRKIFKKNPDGFGPFLQKVVKFVDKSLIPGLEGIHKQRIEALKEITEEKSIVSQLEKTTDSLKKAVKKGLFDSMDSMVKLLDSLGKNIEKGRIESVKDIQESIDDLEDTLKFQKVLRRKAKKADAETKRKEIIETKDQIETLNERIVETNEKYKDAQSEISVVVSEIKKSIGGLPNFKFLEGGTFRGGVMSQIAANLNALHKFLEESSEGKSEEIEELKKWLASPTEFDFYGEFLKKLEESFEDELQVIKNIVDMGDKLKEFEEDFVEAEEKLEISLGNLSVGIGKLVEINSKYAEIFKGEQAETVSSLNTILTATNRTVNKIKANQSILSTAADSMRSLKEVFKGPEDNIKDMKQRIKDAQKEIKRTKRLLGDKATQFKL